MTGRVRDVNSTPLAGVFTAESTHGADTDDEDERVPCALLHAVPLSRAGMAVLKCAERRA